MAKPNALMGRPWEKSVRKAGFIAICVCFGLAIPLIFLWNSEKIGEQTLTKVNIGSTEIIGRKLQMTEGDYFTGIKYGDAERFGDPKLSPLDNPTVATFWPKDCFGKQNKKGAEDCLYLNLYRCRGVTKSDPLPVLVLINVGPNTQNLDPTLLTRILACRGMIIATIGYRKGGMGQFNLKNETDYTPPAVKDVELALKWIKDIIHAFHGDPNKVTVFGAGHGGKVVEFMSKDPRKDPLFQQVIQTQSALELPTLFRPINEFVKENSLMLAQKLNCTSITSMNNTTETEADQALRCLRRVDRKQLHDQLKTLDIRGDDWPLDQSAFYTNGRLIKQRYLPTLLGSCFWNPKNNKNDTKVLEDSLREVLVDLPDFKEFLYKQEIVEYYVEQFGGKTGLEQAMKQIRFDFHTLSGLLLRALEGETTTHYFHSTGFCIENLLFNSNNDHRNVKAQHFFADAVASFVHTGDPNPPNNPFWPRFVTNSTATILSMSDKGFVVSRNPFPLITNFWLCKMAQFTGLNPICG
uniref:COesterase domain-containing protein n=1 Tax=Bursaphelenchus xylophilus TaxID=6326 RepID=A0A1I7RI08_BURXY